MLPGVPRANDTEMAFNYHSTLESLGRTHGHFAHISGNVYNGHLGRYHVITRHIRARSYDQITLQDA